MPEPHKWEWLTRSPDKMTMAKQDTTQLPKLRQSIASAEPVKSFEGDTLPGIVAQLRQRWQQLKLRWFSQSVAAPPIAKERSAHEFATTLLSPESVLQPELAQPSLQQPDRSGAKKPMSDKKDNYQDYLKQEFTTLFENLSLKPQQQQYLKSRWLDQVLWMEGRANKARDMHYRLRLTTIIGGVIVPALVSLNFTANMETQLKQAIAASTFVLSQTVAICAATEQFFNYGERWRHYRRSVETLKTQGWQFFELTGPYENSKTHEEAFTIFAHQVEQILQHDVEIYSTQLNQANKQTEKELEERIDKISNLNKNIDKSAEPPSDS